MGRQSQVPAASMGLADEQPGMFFVITAGSMAGTSESMRSEGCDSGPPCLFTLLQTPSGNPH